MRQILFAIRKVALPIIWLSISATLGTHDGTDRSSKADSQTNGAGASHPFFEHEVSASIRTGNTPRVESDFETLQKLGIKTIVSVDGARPNADLANRYGLRYVHLPVGYGQIPRNRIVEICQLSKTDKIIFVHCHLGKNRGPACAVAAAVALGELQREVAPRVLQNCGLDEHYAQLLDSALNAEPITDAEMSRDTFHFSEYVEPPSLVRRMLEMERLLDELEKRASQPPGDPTQFSSLSLLLLEEFKELKRLPEADAFSPELRSITQQIRELSSTIEQTSDQPTERMADQLLSIRRSCQSCHQSHR